MVWSFPVIAGAVALVQMAFLPGHIVMRALRFRRPVLETLLLSFALSGLINFFLTILFVLCHVYTKHKYWAFVGLEAALWFYLGWRNSRETRNELRSGSSPDFLTKAVEGWRELVPVERAIVLLAAGLGIFALVDTYRQAIELGPDGAFVIWDAVFSWNRWATNWASGIMPVHTFHYPQLMTSNVSIPYVLMRRLDLEFIGKFYVWLYPAGIFLMLLDLGLRFRQVGYWLGGFLVYVALWRMAPPDPGSGHADVPVTFYTWCTLYVLLVGGTEEDARRRRIYFFVGAVVAGAAMLTKQMGCVVAALYPALAWLLMVRTWGLPARRAWRLLGFGFGVTLLVAVPWYIYMQVGIYLGTNLSEISAVAAANTSQTPLGRFLYACGLLSHAFGAVETVCALLFLVVAFLGDRRLRAILLLVFLPATYLWVGLTTYDMRNGTLAIVSGGIAAGVGMGVVLKAIHRAWRSWPDVLRYALVVAAGAAAVFFVSLSPSLALPELVNRYEVAKKQSGDPPFNEALYALLDSGKLKHRLLTNYHMTPFLPRLKEKISWDDFDSIQGTEERIKKWNPDYIAVLREPYPLPPVGGEELQRHLADGTWSVLQEGGMFYIIQRHRHPLPEAARNFHFGIYETVSGLDPQEGPYPQWNLPLVRWGLGPATKLSYHGDGKPLVLKMECLHFGNGYHEEHLQIVLNGKTVAEGDMTDKVWPASLSFNIPATTGENELEIRYSHWDEVSTPGRPLAMLFKTLLLVDK
ncbi:MAG: hypothetical protein ACTHN5_09375 [Phycisphaerae bacterium]